MPPLFNMFSPCLYYLFLLGCLECFFYFDSIMSHFGLIIFSCQFFLSLLVQQLKLSRFLYKKLHVSVKKEENLICMFNVCSCNMLVCTILFTIYFYTSVYVTIRKKRTYLAWQHQGVPAWLLVLSAWKKYHDCNMYHHFVIQ